MLEEIDMSNVWLIVLATIGLAVIFILFENARDISFALLVLTLGLIALYVGREAVASFRDMLEPEEDPNALKPTSKV